METKPASFEEFWPYYVAQHLDPVNRWLHFAGTSMALGCVVASPVVPPLLLAAPVVGYGLSWIGHLGFEKNRPATWSHPWYSFRGDLKMWSLMVRGKMGPELERGREAAAPADELAEAA